MKNLVKNLFKLRLEELLGISFLIPSWIITLYANYYFYSLGQEIPKKYIDGIIRLVVSMIIMGFFIWFVKKKPFWKYTWWIREVLPFIFVIAVYTNLHDTIGFVNSHDIHDYLIKIDEWIFGIEPVLYFQRFYNKYLTDFFSLFYMNYFYVAVSVVLYLLIKKDKKHLREVLLGTILMYYIGYFLYILFPAAPPRLVLHDKFTRDLTGGVITHIQNKIIIDMASSRGSFPSLHCGVSLLSLIYSYKYARKLFYFLILPVIILVIATIYLRHHYTVDIIAGFILAIIVYKITPIIDRKYKEFQKKIENL